ncbi:MAG: response regulator transcription factor [Gammaproteobacteria bacterium]|nr:response regulator transcription factor [Gammaproteobacteria bacterium]
MTTGDPAQIATHRALVVEDDEHIGYLLDFMLRRAGYDVLLAGNGRDAQSVIENVPPVDVILLDLMLPYVSGYQLIEEIREIHDWQHVPIVVLSAKVLEQDVVRALDLGATDYVTKPFRPQELLARLRRAVTDHEAFVGQHGQNRVAALR